VMFSTSFYGEAPTPTKPRLCGGGMSLYYTYIRTWRFSISGIRSRYECKKIDNGPDTL
jgi:hypothetical protein